MAWSTVTYRCGHEADYNFLGKTSERDRKKAWMESNDCPQCQRDRQRANVQAQLAESTLEVTTPELTGSEKQIAWATDIRNEKIAHFPTFLKKMNPKPEEAEKITEMFQALLDDQTKSSYWIDYRSIDVRKLIIDNERRRNK